MAERQEVGLPNERGTTATQHSSLIDFLGSTGLLAVLVFKFRVITGVVTPTGLSFPRLGIRNATHRITLANHRDEKQFLGVLLVRIARTRTRRYRASRRRSGCGTVGVRKIRQSRLKS
jgi:hypothetical protein